MLLSIIPDKMNKNFLLVFGIGLFLVTGCAKKEAKKLVPGEPVEIRYENWEVYPAQLKLHQGVVDAFNNSHKDIHIKFEPVYGGPQKILVEIAGGSAPDIFYQEVLTPGIKKFKNTVNKWGKLNKNAKKPFKT